MISRFRIWILEGTLYFAYVRLILESFENTVMSACLELYNFEITSFANSFSFTFSIVSLSACAFLIIFFIKLSLKSWDNFAPQRKHFWMEIYAGVKNWNYARFYTPGILIKSTFYIVTVLIINQVAPRTTTYTLLLCFQTLY